MTYLGHKCTSEGIMPDPVKFEIVKNYPQPEDKDAVRRFVAFCNYYRRFIPNFSQIATLLNLLTKKKALFNWTPECQLAFLTFKKKLMNSPILQYLDFSK